VKQLIKNNRKRCCSNSAANFIPFIPNLVNPIRQWRSRSIPLWQRYYILRMCADRLPVFVNLLVDRFSPNTGMKYVREQGSHLCAHTIIISGILEFNARCWWIIITYQITSDHHHQPSNLMRKFLKCGYARPSEFFKQNYIDYRSCVIHFRCKASSLSAITEWLRVIIFSRAVSFNPICIKLGTTDDKSATVHTHHMILQDVLAAASDCQACIRHISEVMWCTPVSNEETGSNE